MSYDSWKTRSPDDGAEEPEDKFHEVYFEWNRRRFVLVTDSEGKQTICSIPYAGLHCEIINPSYALWREARYWEAQQRQEYDR